MKTIVGGHKTGFKTPPGWEHTSGETPKQNTKYCTEQYDTSIYIIIVMAHGLHTINNTCQ